MIDTKQERAEVVRQRESDPERIERAKRYALKFSGPYTLDEIVEAPEPEIAGQVKPGGFDKKAYQKELMRKRRAKNKEKAV